MSDDFERLVYGLRDAAWGEGRQDERAAIVRYLRTGAELHGNDVLLAAYAECVERGEHRGMPEPAKRPSVSPLDGSEG